MKGVSIFDAVHDPQVFGPWFKDPESWAAWFTFLTALFGLQMTPDQMRVFQECTGRTLAPRQAFNEATLICGRRSGKSFILALVAVFLAVWRNWQPHLQPGERATILVLATDRRQARAIYRFARGLLTETPMLKPLIERETAEVIELSNSVSIEIATASFRRTRGYAIAAALLDELAFWPAEDSAAPDYAVIDALKPGMVQFPQPMLLMASSPYARRGALWDSFQRSFGKDEAPALVWKAPTRTMNPSVPESVIKAAYERDPAWAAAEYGAEFRTDRQALVTREAVMACVDEGVLERRPERQHVYYAACDPSGGSSDSFTLSVSHKEGTTAVLDLIREVRPPFSPAATVIEFAAVLKSYHIHEVQGDNYGAEWVAEAFRDNGIYYRAADKTRSEIYLNALPHLNSHDWALLDHPRLHAQLIALERRTSRNGRDVIDHPEMKGAHDDICNSAMLALLIAHSGDSGFRMTREEREEEYRRQYPGADLEHGVDPLRFY